MSDELQGEVSIGSEADLITVRKTVRAVVTRLGFGVTDATRIVTAASELARNVYVYAKSGILRWRVVDSSAGIGIELIFEDKGPGISDIKQAVQEGFSTSGGMGMGLSGTKRLMDEMEVQSVVGKGTTVTVRKWQRK